MNGGRIDARFAGTVGGFALDVAFDIPAHGVTGLFGPSGCGKTTILRCLAGLTRLPGRLSVDGALWQDDPAFVPPHRRAIGYVFQEASLFPHLSVRANLLYGQRRAGTDALAVDDVVHMLGIAALLDRAPGTLSGGERQRVAVGRALLSQPRLLLMDEPLAALDRATKEEILPYLERLRDTLSIPIVYVSHDLTEIERLADTLVLVERGRIRAAGPLAALEADPSLPLIGAPEAAATLDGTVAAVDEAYALTTFAVAGGAVIVPGKRGAPGTRQRLRIRASDVSFVREPPQASTILNCLPARILAVSPHGREAAQVNLVAALGADGAGAHIVARITRKSCEALALQPGAPIYAQIKSVALLAG